MAKRAIKISEEFVEIASKEGQLMHRSASAQLEYWAKIGREVEARGALGPSGIRSLLSGHGSVQDLSEADDVLYVSTLAEKLEALDGSDERPLNDLRAGGYPIASADEQGKVVVESPPHTTQPSRRSD